MDESASSPRTPSARVQIRWADFEHAEPEFARRVRTLLTSRKHLTMATLRSDGSPRISGTLIEFADGELRIESNAGALRARDLRRDPRIAIHGPTNEPPELEPWRWEGEAKVAGQAIELATGRHFQIGLLEVVITRLDAATRRPVIELWTPIRGYKVMDPV